MIKYNHSIVCIFFTFPCFTLLHYTYTTLCLSFLCWIRLRWFSFCVNFYIDIFVYVISPPTSKMTQIVWYSNLWLDNNGKLIYPHLSTDKRTVTSLIYSWTNCLCAWWKCGSRDVFFTLPWKQQGSCHDALSRFLWHQTQAPSGQGFHTCSLHSASLSAACRAGRPGKNAHFATVWLFSQNNNKINHSITLAKAKKER